METMNCMSGPCGIGTLGMSILTIAFLFDFILKGIALWKAGNNKHKGWFIALFIINSIGILPLIYMFVIDKKKSDA